jgi:hypothetical protein
MEEQKKKISLEVTGFANALKKWAADDPDRGRLLRWLLSRCESRGFKGPLKSRGFKGPKEKGKYVIRRIDINNIPIVETVERALAGYNPDLPTSGWIRGGPIWPKAYGDMWPKAYGEIWPKAYGP